MATKYFRLSRKHKLFYGLVIGLGLVPIASLILCIGGFLITTVFAVGQGSIGRSELIFLLVIGFLLVAAIGAMLILFLHLRKSQIYTAPEGITYRYWPSIHLKATWDQISDINRNRYIFYNLDTMKLSSFTRVGFNLIPLGVVHLSYFEGWPEGELAAEIKKYAPHLIE